MAACRGHVIFRSFMQNSNGQGIFSESSRCELSEKEKQTRFGEGKPDRMGQQYAFSSIAAIHQSR
jgi:hypothetical protein